MPEITNEACTCRGTSAVPDCMMGSSGAECCNCGHCVGGMTHQLESARAAEAAALEEVTRLREEESTILDASLRLADERDSARAEADQLRAEVAALRSVDCEHCRADSEAAAERDAARARVAELEGRIGKVRQWAEDMGWASPAEIDCIMEGRR